jgi:hypothetical protein
LQPPVALANETLRKLPGSNLSFTGIINHMVQGLRPGKNPCSVRAWLADERVESSRMASAEADRGGTAPDFLREIRMVWLKVEVQIALCPSKGCFVNHSMATFGTDNGCSCIARWPGEDAAAEKGT